MFKRLLLMATTTVVALTPTASVIAAPTDYYDTWVTPITQDVSALSDLQLESNTFVLVYDEAKGSYKVELDPEALTTDAYDKLVGDINTALDDLKDEINGRADQVKIAVAAAIAKFKDIETQLNQLASDIEQRVNQAIDEVVAQLRVQIGQLAYDYTFNQVFDQDEWDTVYNDKLAELNGQYSDYDDFLDSPLISLSGVTVPAALAPYLSGYTVRDLVDNSADITGDIEDARQAAIDAAQGVKDAAYNYADGISNCNQLSTGVERFACNLVGLNNYKNDLKSVADGVYNVAVSAANTAATSATNALAGFVTAVNAAAPVDPGDPADFSGLARAYADLLVRAPAEAEAGIAKTAAEAAFDQAIAQIKTQIDNLRAEVKAYVDEYIARAKDYIRDAIAEIEAYADKVAEWADQTWNKILTLDSGLTLTATTTHLASGATGSSTESYTIGDIVDAINGKNKALFENNYALTLPASIFDGVNSCTLASLNACSEITLNHQFTLDFDLPALTLEGFTIPEIAVPLLDFDELKIDLPYIGTVNLNNLLNNRIQAAVANLNNQLGLTGGYTVGDITFGGLHRVLATADSETWVKLVKPAAAVIIDNGGEQPISEVVDELTAPSTGMQLANDNAWLITLASLVLLGSAVVVTRKFATEK